MSVLIEDRMNKLHDIKQFSIHTCITLIRNSQQDHAALHAQKEAEGFFR